MLVVISSMGTLFGTLFGNLLKTVARVSLFDHSYLTICIAIAIISRCSHYYALTAVLWLRSFVRDLTSSLANKELTCTVLFCISTFFCHCLAQQDKRSSDR